MSKGENEKKNEKTKNTLFGSDEVVDAEIVIASDKDTNRQNAFKEAYKKVMQIVPNYFLTTRKRKSSTSSSSGFSQSIVITPENAKIETKETVQNENIKEEKGRERDD